MRARTTRNQQMSLCHTSSLSTSELRNIRRRLQLPKTLPNCREIGVTRAIGAPPYLRATGGCRQLGFGCGHGRRRSGRGGRRGGCATDADGSKTGSQLFLGEDETRSAPAVVWVGSRIGFCVPAPRRATPPETLCPAFCVPTVSAARLANRS